ncbi:integrase catalytic domain-containing protein [Nephila pilipes]|uniref:Integrase catalytic domain-containing protein n=1 Tax=Nephila pilipes TaxID=299642 RepID=A0A8X6TIM8_NEPPI|nr:integrase catalytic domain-containing protein [Nephila pilipes]
MTTILAEIELVLNNRPITYTSNDLIEPLPLTPAHFLFPGQENLSYPVHFVDLISNKPSTKENLSQRIFYQTQLLRQIWGKWKNNYLMQLRNAHNFVNPNSVNDLKRGDVVLIEGTTKSKYLWPLGIIEDVIIGLDGHIRSGLVRTAKGHYKRPIQLIYPLKII